MSLDPLLRRQIVFYIKILIFSAAVGIVVAILRTPSPMTAGVILQGALSGILIGLGCSLTEALVNGSFMRRRAKHMPLLVFVLLQALGFSVSILVGLTWPIYVFTGEWVLDDPAFRSIFVVSGLIAFAISLATEMTRLLGKEATTALLTGRYKRPRLEERIVLFADIAGSTALAERIGDLRFHAFLSDVAFELNRPVERALGDVHRYVGDEVIVTWPMRRRGAAEAALHCAAQMHETLKRAAPGFVAKVDQAPSLRISIHAGAVAAGEIGGWKKEIALLGDTMNTTARLEAAARKLGVRTIVSDDFRRLLPIDAQEMLAPLPAYAAAGKKDALQVWRADPQ